MLALIGFVSLSMLVWGASGAATTSSVRGWYLTLARPPGTPPNWLFGPVWTVLYLTIGVSAWLVWRRIDVGLERKRAALRVWGWQLLLNAAWAPAFFGLRSTAWGLMVIVPLLGAILLTIRRFLPLQRWAALLLVPYAVWISYATYLNAALWWLNPF